MQGEGVDAEEEISFVYRKQRFVYDEDAHCFKKLKFPVEVCGCQLQFCFPHLQQQMKHHKRA